MATEINTAVIKDGKVMQVKVSTDITPGVGIHLLGINDKTIRDCLLRTITAMQSQGYFIPGRKICTEIDPDLSCLDECHCDLPIAIGIIMSSEQVDLREVNRCLIMGQLNLDGTLRDIHEPQAMAEYARSNDLLVTMPMYQALTLPKELIEYTLMVDSLSELVEILKVK